MKYTLAENAVSSLSIAIDNFKKFYYFANRYSRSQIDESTKICIIFLENSIELMLKTILVSTNPLSIYEHPESQTIRNALCKTNNSYRLEDVLISEGNFNTIRYKDTVQKYNDKHHKSEKVHCVLKKLGEIRNTITHFGIDSTYTWDELIVNILNSFDIIYNYLYPQLIEIDDISHYFTSDDVFVDTIHGVKTLFDDNFIYNNIIDFLDELMEESKDYVCILRALNPTSKIIKFTEIMKIVIEDKKFNLIFARYQAQIEVHTCDFDNNNFYFEITKGSEWFDAIISCYSPYFNVTAFCGEGGNIYFLIVHDKSELYIYNQSQYTKWPQHDEAELDNQWSNDCENGFCKKYTLSKRNLLLAFENILVDEQEL